MCVRRFGVMTLRSGRAVWVLHVLRAVVVAHARLAVPGVVTVARVGSHGLLCGLVWLILLVSA